MNVHQARETAINFNKQEAIEFIQLIERHIRDESNAGQFETHFQVPFANRGIAACIVRHFRELGFEAGYSETAKVTVRWYVLHHTYAQKEPK